MTLTPTVLIPSDWTASARFLENSLTDLEFKISRHR